MVRLAWICLPVAALALAGCENKKNPPAARTEQPQPSLEQMDKSTTASPSWDTSEPVSPPPREAAATASPAPRSPAPRPSPTSPPKTQDETLKPAPGGKTYVAQKGDSLYKIAKKFYNDGSKWKKIWEANKTRVPDPNKLKEGTKLIIP